MNNSYKIETNNALKEWAVAVNALEQGETIMLLRKGGIKEVGNKFQVAHREVLLYPTYEHQKPHLLKSEYANQVSPVVSGWHPERVKISSWANITDIFAVTAADILEELIPYHIWNQQFARERFKWKPKQPLYILLLRTYRLSKAVEIPYESGYGGCKSWIDLSDSLALDASMSVFDDNDYIQQVATIRRIIGFN